MDTDLITQRLKLKEIFPDSLVTAYSQRYGVPKESIEFIRKGYTPIDVKFVEGEKAAISYINTAAIDRDAEVTLPEGGIMDAFRENPCVMFGHDYKNLPIGKCDSLKLDSKGWLAKTVYANTAKATEVYEYRRAGFPLAESIGFIPIESLVPGESGFDELAKDLVKRGAFKRGDTSKIGRIHTKWVMLEYSDVPIPSNPEALQIAIAKGLILPEVLIDDIANAPIVDLTGEPDVVTKPEETPDFIRIPVDTGNHSEHRIRTITISEKDGIKALYCGTDKTIITYLFDKSEPYNWTTPRARAWVKDHEKTVVLVFTLSGELVEGMIFEHIVPVLPVADVKRKEHPISQEEIKDELDYLDTMITSAGLSKETAFDAVDVAIRTMARAWPYHQWESITLGEKLTGESQAIIFKRISGSDIPVKDIKETLTIQDIQEAIKRIAKT